MSWERVNPSRVAENGRANVLGEYQPQWAGFKGHPDLLFASFNLGLPGSSDHAAGLSFLQNKEGMWVAKRIALQYAYRIPIKNGCIGLGLDAGFADCELDLSGADAFGDGGAGSANDEFHSSSDPLLTQTGSNDDNDIVFDLAFGASLKYKSWEAGISVQHLNKARLEPVQNYEFAISPLMNLYVEYQLRNKAKTLLYKPALIAQTNFSSLHVGMMNTCVYNDKFTFGVNAWFWSSMSFMVGFEVVSGLNLGYSYGLPTNKMIKSGGSHDIAVRYSFDLNFSKKGKYKNSRIL